MRLLIVEDHIKINNLLAKFARQEHHQVKQAYCSEDALEIMKSINFDLIITDLMLPDMQGEELIETVRKVSDVYIMVISAKTDVSDRVDLLNLGADDYLTKPFSVEEVMAKLRNVSKRIDSKKPLIHSFYQGEVVVHPLERTVTFQNEIVPLTAYEYDVFYYLMNHQSRIFSRDEIIMALFSDSEAYDRVIDAYIKNIRKKLNDDPKSPRYIKTIHRLGYQFIGESDD